MSEHVLVTGGAGFIGGRLAERLLALGHRVRVLDSLEPQVHGAAPALPAWLGRDAEFIQGSVSDPTAVTRSLDGIDVVFHQAALVGVGQSMYDMARYCRENTVGAAVLLEEAVRRRGRLRRMVVASSMSCYGEGAYARPDGTRVAPSPRAPAQLARGAWELEDPDTGESLTPVPTPEDQPLRPTSVYAVTKRDHEELFLAVGRAYGIPTVALRYFNTYGPGQALANPYTAIAAIFSTRLLNGHAPVIFEDGGQQRDFVHVSDVVAANVAAMTAPAADVAINVGTGTPTTVLEVAERLAVLLDRPIAPEITGRFREGDIRHCYADIGRARRALGYAPRVAFADGLTAVADWVRDQAPEDRFDRALGELAERGLA